MQNQPYGDLTAQGGGYYASATATAETEIDFAKAIGNFWNQTSVKVTREKSSSASTRSTNFGATAAAAAEATKVGSAWGLQKKPPEDTQKEWVVNPSMRSALEGYAQKKFDKSEVNSARLTQQAVTLHVMTTMGRQTVAWTHGAAQRALVTHFEAEVGQDADVLLRGSVAIEVKPRRESLTSDAHARRATRVAAYFYETNEFSTMDDSFFGRMQDFTREVETLKAKYGSYPRALHMLGEQGKHKAETFVHNPVTRTLNQRPTVTAHDIAALAMYNQTDCNKEARLWAFRGLNSPTLVQDELTNVVPGSKSIDELVDPGKLPQSSGAIAKAASTLETLPLALVVKTVQLLCLKPDGMANIWDKWKLETQEQEIEVNPAAPFDNSNKWPNESAPICKKIPDLGDAFPMSHPDLVKACGLEPVPGKLGLPKQVTSIEGTVDVPTLIGVLTPPTLVRGWGIGPSETPDVTDSTDPAVQAVIEMVRIGQSFRTETDPEASSTVVTDWYKQVTASKGSELITGISATNSDDINHLRRGILPPHFSLQALRVKMIYKERFGKRKPGRTFPLLDGEQLMSMTEKLPNPEFQLQHQMDHNAQIAKIVANLCVSAGGFLGAWHAGGNLVAIRMPIEHQINSDTQVFVQKPRTEILIVSEATAEHPFKGWFMWGGKLCTVLELEEAGISSIIDRPARDIAIATDLLADGRQLIAGNSGTADRTRSRTYQTSGCIRRTKLSALLACCMMKENRHIQYGSDAFQFSSRMSGGASNLDLEVGGLSLTYGRSAAMSYILSYCLVMLGGVKITPSLMQCCIAINHNSGTEREGNAIQNARGTAILAAEESVASLCCSYDQYTLRATKPPV